MLALNAFKDGLQALPWSLEDLRRIVQTPGFSAEILVSRARHGRVVSLLWIVADWLFEEIGAAGWGAVRRAIGSRPPSARIAGAHRLARTIGWPPKLGLIIVAASSDGFTQPVRGLTLALAGILRRKAAKLTQSP